jgi:hypothetical protein
MSKNLLALHAKPKRREEGADEALPEIRCRRCRRLLMKGEIKQVEIKCPKCGCVQKIQRA